MNYSIETNSKLSYAIFKHSDALFMGPYSEERLSTLSRSKFDLVMYTCALIASKVSEIDDNWIRIYEIEKDSKYQFAYKIITKWEVKILEELNWSFMIQTPLTYLNLFLSSGVLFSDDSIEDIRLQEYTKDIEK